MSKIMKEDVIKKYVKDLHGLLEEIRKMPSEIKTALGQTPPTKTW